MCTIAPVKRFAAVLAVVWAVAIGASAEALAGSSTTALGDGRVSVKSAGAVRAWSCALDGVQKPADRPWIRGGRVYPAQRPVLAERQIEGADGLPLLRTGKSLSLDGKLVSGRLPRRPRRARPRCVDPGLPIGVARNGVPIMPAFDETGADLAAREPADKCGGVTDAAGRYFYRAGLSCLDRGSRRRHSSRVGYARDGYPIYGQRERRGKKLRSRDLDACHGHTHTIRFRGARRRSYHYHLTADFPHTVGCFRSRPSKSWRLADRPDARDRDSRRDADR